MKPSLARQLATRLAESIREHAADGEVDACFYGAGSSREGEWICLTFRDLSGTWHEHVHYETDKQSWRDDPQYIRQWLAVPLPIRTILEMTTDTFNVIHRLEGN